MVGDKVLCSYHGKMFRKQGIRNHTAKCAEKNGFQDWGRLKHEPVSDLADGFDDPDDDDDELDNALQRHDSRKIDFTDRAGAASPALRPSTARVGPQGEPTTVTPEQQLAVALKKFKALEKANAALPSSSDSNSSRHFSPEKKKKKSK